MGGVWEPKILDFPIFFDVFSKWFLKHNREEPKIDPRGATKRRWWIFGPGFRWSPLLLGRKKKRGSRTWAYIKSLTLSDSPFEIGLGEFESDLVKMSSTPSSPKGGRRIETPRGGPPPPTLFSHACGGRIALRGCTLGACTLKKVGLLSLFSILGMFGIVDFRRHFLEDLLGRHLPKICEKIVEIQFWRLQHRAWEPPKSSSEPSKRQFSKDT